MTARPGGRTARIGSAVFRATIDLLATQPWEAVTVDAIATASGVHRTTIYRRWGGRKELVAAVAAAHAETAVAIPDTGTLRGDLTQLASDVARALRSPVGRALIRLAVSAGEADQDLADIRRQFFRDRYQLLRPVVARAIERGEVPAGTDPLAVGRTLSAPLLTRVLVTGEDIDDAAAEEAANICAAAARSGVLISPAGLPGDSPL